jgi:uncharacterized membrane protein HdeD (DUF308 family)
MTKPRFRHLVAIFGTLLALGLLALLFPRTAEKVGTILGGVALWIVGAVASEVASRNMRL